MTDWDDIYRAAEAAAEAAGLHLVRDESGLALAGGELALTADFVPDIRRLGAAELKRELLVRAALGRSGRPGGRDADGGPPRAIDATAGLGEDSLLLAAAGYYVDLYEANPVIAVLLKDALIRAGRVPELKAAASRMSLHFGDSIEAMRQLSFRPALILLDPMFPRRKKSGLVKKKFQLLQRLEHPCENEADLLAAACAAQPEKILIKRPAKGPCLAGAKPSYAIGGGTIRYDCIVCA